ncbi:HNH endonuclease [Agrobacterium rubi]|nr:HNH endonuclease [Agrobacterium rubi]NTF25064.1 HNH endonuclease [Agrobacterium rubi]
MKKIAQFLTFLAFAISISVANPAFSGSSVAPSLGKKAAGKLLGKLAVPGIALGAAGAGAVHAQRGRVEITSSVSQALDLYGTTQGQLAMDQTKSLLAKHLVVGKRAATAALAANVARSPDQAQLAPLFIAELGLNPELYQNLLVVAKKDAAEESVHTDSPAAISSEGQACASGEQEDRLSERNRPGIARGGATLPFVTSSMKWWHGTARNIIQIPRQVSTKLKGHPYSKFDDLRKDIWRTIGNDPALHGPFTYIDIAMMKNGKAPLAEVEQSNPGKFGRSYQIHHKTPIHDGGAVYSFDNLVIVTPRCHKEILDPNYHYNYGRK